MDDGGDDKARAHPERNQDFDQGRPEGTLRIPWLLVWAALLVEEWPAVSGREPIQEESVQRIKAKVSELVVSGNKGSWPDVRDRLNRLLSGWSAYFSHGTRVPAYRAVDAHVYDRVQNFLCRRHNVSRRGTSRFSFAAVFGDLAVLHLMRAHNGRPPWVVR